MAGFGASDLIIIPIALDNILTDFAVRIGRNQIAVGRMDAIFRIRIGSSSAYSGTIDRPFTLVDCDDLIDTVFITTTAAIAGGLIELWCSNPTSVGFQS